MHIAPAHEHPALRAGGAHYVMAAYYGPLYATIQAFKQRQGQSETAYRKANARLAAALRALAPALLPEIDAVVPMPSSRADARARLRDCALAAWPQRRVVSCLRIKESGYETFHHLPAPQRPDSEYLAAKLTLSQPLSRALGRRLLVIDDVITTGTHCHAARIVLERAGFTVKTLCFAGAPGAAPGQSP